MYGLAKGAAVELWNADELVFIRDRGTGVVYLRLRWFELTFYLKFESGIVLVYGVLNFIADGNEFLTKIVFHKQSQM
jgi:hypothetical protein